MPAPRSTPRGPADATGTIVDRAFKGVVASSILVPVLQTVLIETYAATQNVQTADSNAFAPQMELILQSGLFTLALLPVATTIASMAISYTLARGPGVVFYVVASFLLSAWISGMMIAMIILVTAILVFMIVLAITGSGGRRRRPRHRLR